MGSGGRTARVAVGIVLVGALCWVLAAQGTRNAGTVTQLPRAADGRPALSGIWQAVNTAHWDLQDHPASQGPVIALGAAYSVPPGHGVVEGNEIPYQPWAAAQQRTTRTG